MDDEHQNGWIMLASISVMSVVAMALIYVPELRPEQAVLDCDARGGVWSPETRHCETSDSPLAGTSP
ncbi:MAG: hypothetical protein AAGC57_16630 [Pseudomonadota bacterium]